MKKIILTLSTLILLPLFSLPKTIEEVFYTIYHEHRWGGGRETVSGGGSTLRTTETIREELPRLIRRFNIKTLLDSPCGDFNWMRKVDLSFLEEYIGIDVVPDIITKNQNRYGSEKIVFICRNIVNTNLPKADLILCRDCLVHLKNEDVFTILKNFKESNATYLLATTYPILQKNSTLSKTGRWRAVNLQLPPYNFPEPIMIINDTDFKTGAYQGKKIGLWSLKDIMLNL